MPHFPNLDPTMPVISPNSQLSPVSPMSPAKPSVRPPHLVLSQHSSSLYGMEIAVPSPLTPGFQESSAARSKALPQIPRNESAHYYSPHSAPTSRKTSWAYSDSEEERPSTLMTPRKASTTHTKLNDERTRTRKSALQDELLSSNSLLVPPGTRSSTSKIPDKLPPRPQLKRDAYTQGGSQFNSRKQLSGDSILKQWAAPKYEYSDDEYSSSLPASAKASSRESWGQSEPMPSAEERAKDYASVLPKLVPESLDSESEKLSTGMSARIINVDDGSLISLPLALSRNSEDRELSSQFSSSDSDIEGLLGEPKPTLKSRARKALNSRKLSEERKRKAPAELKESHRNQAGELSTANLASLQKGIDEMYSTLTGIYSTAKSKKKHGSATSTSDLRRPSIPLTADGRPGKRAWDSLKNATSLAAKRDDSVGKKLVNVLQNGATAVGFDRGREDKLKDEE